ncbi:hypothetical protein Moror_15588 [Moniliophthora roreri MCA 2997]|uniref:Uncharacterized protein n=1 Tax=Moniliophthora roreri (strain MCA 2997) TaxID=1381753 RepID=V2XVK2_MONRO|nr:hypothetical protein Moror_15588 [Moniliophthora roreri MCA 2997]
MTIYSEGIKYGCGHYVKTRDVNTIDCGSRYCKLSKSHPKNCTLEECNIHYGPDRKEDIIHTTERWCQPCDDYWKPNGRRN